MSDCCLYSALWVVGCQELSFQLLFSCGVQETKPPWPPGLGDQRVPLCRLCVPAGFSQQSIRVWAHSLASERQWENVLTACTCRLQECSRRVPCPCMCASFRLVVEYQNPFCLTAPARSVTVPTIADLSQAVEELHDHWCSSAQAREEEYCTHLCSLISAWQCDGSVTTYPLLSQQGRESATLELTHLCQPDRCSVENWHLSVPLSLGRISAASLAEAFR